MEADTESRTVSVADVFPNLTPRERQVLALTVMGQSTKMAAMSLGLSPRTIEDHRATIYRKTGIDNMVALAHRILGVPKVVA